MNVAGSSPVGRSISKSIVGTLLEDDVDDFLDRQSDHVSVDLISKNLTDSGFTEAQWAEVDGIEVYPMVWMNATDYPGSVGGWERVDSMAKATHYGVSLHVRGGGLYDAGEFTNPQQARVVVKLLRKMIRRKVHLIDEIGESEDIDPMNFIETTFSPVCKAVDVQRDLHDADFHGIRVFKGGPAGAPPEYSYVEAWLRGPFYNVRKEFRRVLKRHGLWNMQLPPSPQAQRGTWNKEGWVDDRQRNMKGIDRRCHIYVPPWAVDFEGHSPL